MGWELEDELGVEAGRERNRAVSLPDASVVHLDHMDLVEDGQDLRHGDHATWLGLRTGQQEKKDERKET